MTLPHPSGDQHWTRRRPELIPRGVDAPGAKLGDADLVAIAAMDEKGMLPSKIAALRDAWLTQKECKQVNLGRWTFDISEASR